MINLIFNPLINTYKIYKKQKLIYSFRTTKEIDRYIKKNVIQKTKFINSALNFYIMLINSPKNLLITLKKRYPEIWRFVNRKKFI